TTTIDSVPQVNSDQRIFDCRSNLIEGVIVVIVCVEHINLDISAFFILRSPRATSAELAISGHSLNSGSEFRREVLTSRRISRFFSHNICNRTNGFFQLGIIATITDDLSGLVIELAVQRASKVAALITCTKDVRAATNATSSQHADCQDAGQRQGK